MVNLTLQPDPKLAIISQLLVSDTSNSEFVSTSDVQELTKLAIEHGVAALICENNKQKNIRSALCKSLGDVQQHQNFRNQLLNQHFQHALTQLSAIGVDYVVLKGFALGHTIYENYLLRTKSDVDIIIRIKDRDSVISAFTAMGFRNPRGWNPREIINQFSMRKTLSPGLNVDFDVHLKISNGLSVEDIITFDELVISADTTTLKNIPLVSKPLALVHAIVHLLHHRNMGDTVKLIWFYDLFLLCQTMSSLDKATFNHSIEKKGLSTLAKCALSLANMYFKSDAIKSTIDSLKENTNDSNLDYLTNIDGRLKYFLRSFKQRKNRREKWLFIREIAFPPAEEIYKKYGEQPAYRLPFFYLHRILQGITKHLLDK